MGTGTCITSSARGTGGTGGFSLGASVGGQLREPPP